MTDNLPPAPNPSADEEAVLAWSLAEKIDFLMTGLSVNKTQMAQVLIVSRQTLYAWLQNEKPADACELAVQRAFGALFAAGVTRERPLNARLVRLGMQGQRPLLELLTARPLDAQRIAETVASIRSFDEEEIQRRSDREQRLKAAGFEPVSDEHRRTALLAYQVNRPT